MAGKGGWIAAMVIDPKRREYGMVREVSTRLSRGFKRRVMVQVQIEPALKAGGYVTRWYRARDLVRVGPYAVVMPRERKPLPLRTVPRSSPAAFDIFRDAIAQQQRDLGDDRFDGAPGMYAPVEVASVFGLRPEQAVRA